MKPLEVVILLPGADWRSDFRQRSAENGLGIPTWVTNRSLSESGLPPGLRMSRFIPREFVACDVSGKKELFRATLVYDHGDFYRASGTCRVSGEVGECYVEGDELWGGADRRPRRAVETGELKFLSSGEKIMIQVRVP